MFHEQLEQFESSFTNEMDTVIAKKNGICNR